jgi:hypothetical protein
MNQPHGWLIAVDLPLEAIDRKSAREKLAAGRAHAKVWKTDDPGTGIILGIRTNRGNGSPTPRTAPPAVSDQ